MPPRLADRLREHAKWMARTLDYMEAEIATVEEAAAALDRTEALEQAAQAWATAYRAAVDDMNMSRMKAQSRAELTLLALFPPDAALSGGDPQ